MALRPTLLALAGALLLASSPNAILRAQDAAPPAADAPAEGQDPTLLLRRKHKPTPEVAPQGQEAAPQPSAEPVVPKKPKPPAAPAAVEQPQVPKVEPLEPVVPKKPKAPAPVEATDQPAETPAAPLVPKKPKRPVQTQEAAPPAEAPAEPVVVPKKPKAPAPAEATDQPAEPVVPKKPKRPVQTQETEQPAPAPVEPATPAKPPAQVETTEQPAAPVVPKKPRKPVLAPDTAGQPAAPTVEQPLQPQVEPVKPVEPTVQPQPIKPATPIAPVEAGQGGGTDALLKDNRAPNQLSADELRARVIGIRRALADPATSPEQRQALRRALLTSQQEFRARQAQGGGAPLPAGQPAPPVPGEPAPLPAPLPTTLPRVPDAAPAVNPTPPLDQATVDPAADQRARKLLTDSRPADGLPDEALRQRLEALRNALAVGDLSPETSRALRQRLQEDRIALRNRVADQEQQDQPGGPRRRPGQQPDAADNGGPGLPPVMVVRPPSPQDIPGLLADRRRAGDLDDAQLNRRIQAYRDAVTDERYAQDRDAYVQYLEADRAELRQRLGRERRQRLLALQQEQAKSQLSVQLNIGPRGAPRPTIFAAEEDDQEIEDQLISRPLHPLPQRYSRQMVVEQAEAIIQQPAVRQAIPSVELDTIHFGFNEAFVREEEITNIDRIGRIIEKIVTAHPNEVFMIEGHTDAVGTDEANIALSRKRAEAVKAALIQYYAIQPDNLITAGLGERYLKVPTTEPEQENRRVTLRRVTEIMQN